MPAAHVAPPLTALCDFSDPVLLVSYLILLIGWSIVGCFIHRQLDPLPKPFWGDAWLVALCGPVIWALSLWELILTAVMLVRPRPPKCGCCSCHSRHPTPGYPADSLTNQP